MSTTEQDLARALVEAHTAPEVRTVVLQAFDKWAKRVLEAQDALEQQQRSEDDLRRYYTVKELRLLLKLSDSGVRALIDSGELPHTRIGGAIRVPIADVDRYLAERTQRTEAPVKARPARPRIAPEDAAVLKRWPGIAD